MSQIKYYSLFYDIIAYMVAFRSLIDEILYKFGFKRKLDFDKELPSNLCGHVAIVTGGTRGLGLTVVRVLVSRGCFVFVASSQTRDKFPQILEKIYEGMPERNTQTGVVRGTVRLHNLDLSSMKSVSEFIKAFKATKLGLTYLICNAGIMFAPRQLTVDGFESHLAVNFLGHCLLILELLPELKKSADTNKTNSRIVSVASSTHAITRFKFDDISSDQNYSSSQAYAQSKLAQIMFTAKLSRVIKNNLCWNNVECFSLHPGVILSELYEHVHLIKYFPFLKPIIKLVTRDMVQGAETTVYASLSRELDNKSGQYLEDCAIKEPSARAKNVEDQDRLWDLTYDLLSPWISKGFTDAHSRVK